MTRKKLNIRNKWIFIVINSKVIISVNLRSINVAKTKDISGRNARKFIHQQSNNSNISKISKISLSLEFSSRTDRRPEATRFELRMKDDPRVPFAELIDRSHKRIYPPATGQKPTVSSPWHLTHLRGDDRLQNRYRRCDVDIAAPVSIAVRHYARYTFIHCYPACTCGREQCSRVRYTTIEIGCNTAATCLTIVTDMSGQVGRVYNRICFVFLEFFPSNIIISPRAIDTRASIIDYLPRDESTRVLRLYGNPALCTYIMYTQRGPI